jgi:thiol-disulfide isomerase/thioredoxin
MGRLFGIFLLLISLLCSSFAQSEETPEGGTDAAVLLRQLNEKYTAAKYYHIEATEEREWTGDLSRQWEKSTYTAVLLPENRYRFEALSQYSASLKISDGTTETYFNLDSLEYTQQKLSGPGPIQQKGPIDQWAFGMMTVTALLKNLAGFSNSLLSPSFQPEETIIINRQQVPCYVIKGRLKYRGGSARVSSEATLWIEKNRLLIRKSLVRSVGPVIVDSPRNYVDDTTFVYTVADIGEVPSLSDSLFSFHPPAGAQLVQEFSNSTHRKDMLAGSHAPDVTLSSAKGKHVSLHDFRGKPVLLDFWATWCAPCVAAFEPLKKMYAETAPKGLVMLAINEDNDPEAAAKFFATHSVDWPNFYDSDGEIFRSFPTNGGIPFYVLINAEGKVVFSQPGARDSELRAAISKLGLEPPGDISKSEKTADKAK